MINKHFRYFLDCKKDNNSTAGTNALKWAFGVLFLKPDILDSDKKIRVNEELAKLLQKSEEQSNSTNKYLLNKEELINHVNNIWDTHPDWDKSKDWDKFLEYMKQESQVLHQYISPTLDKTFTKEELFSYCNNKNTSDINALLAILSWGGVRDINGERIFKDPTLLLDFVNKLRNNRFKTRSEAYNEIIKNRRAKELPGLGVVYITQLISFLDPNLNGYIMGQWVAKSINLITENDIVIIGPDGAVEDNNEAANYEYFCLALSFITFVYKTLKENAPENLTTTDIEQYLFSQGGRKKGEWREYVLKNS